MSAVGASWPRVPLAFAVSITVALGAAPLVANLMEPNQTVAAPTLQLEDGVPPSVNGWIVVPSPVLQTSLDLKADADGPTNEKPYDQVVMRNYRNATGDIAMLAIAYARVQRQEVKIHRPDLCYRAQGFQLLAGESTQLPILLNNGQRVPGRRLLAQRGERLEAVVYWLRTGTQYTDRAWDARLHILAEGLEGRVPDGVLVRASRLIRDPRDAAAAWEQLEGLLADIVIHSSAEVRPLLLR